MTSSPRTRKPRPVALPRGNTSLWSRSLNTNELANHIAYCQTTAPNTTERGGRLEQLATWLFPHVPGLSVAKTNVFSHDGGHEVDVPLFNDFGMTGALPQLESPVFVECKNYDRRVGGQEVAWFDHKLIQGGSSAGILLTTEGVTGDQRERTFAYGVLAHALMHRRRILILTLDDLAVLASTADLRLLLQRKLMDLSTGRPF